MNSIFINRIKKLQVENGIKTKSDMMTDLDSIRLVTFIVSLEEEFDITIPDELSVIISTLSNAQIAEEIVNLLGRKVKK